MKNNEEIAKLEQKFNYDIYKILEQQPFKEELKNKYKKENVSIIYSLINIKDYKKSFAMMIDENLEDKLLINPYIKNRIKLINYYEYNYDDYLFKYLEKDYQIINMSIIAHYSAWCQIQEFYPNLYYKKGMQNYLKYCKEKNITQNKLKNAVGASQLFNVMKYYKEKNVKER